MPQVRTHALYVRDVLKIVLDKRGIRNARTTEPRGMSKENTTTVQLTDTELLDVVFALSRMEERLREYELDDMADRHKILHNNIIVEFDEQRNGESI